jgi:hypothetical protein
MNRFYCEYAVFKHKTTDSVKRVSPLITGVAEPVFRICPEYHIKYGVSFHVEK